MINNDVIIIGGNHHNMLGVIRMLGEEGIHPSLIVTNQNRYAYVTKSKYVKDYDVIAENETEMREILLKKYASSEEKPILFPTSDFAALFIDKNLNLLKKYFIVPSIDNKQGKIVELMDKYRQYQFIKKFHIPMVETKELEIGKEMDKEKWPCPCILKPKVSAFGKKCDIKICNNKEEILEAIEEFKKKEYTSLIVQELLDYDYECNIIGCSSQKKIIIPAITKKIRIYPKKSGSVTFGKVVKVEKFNSYITKIIEMLKEINYQGLFDIEFFIKENEIYLNEINFRNSGNTYVFMYDHINLPYIWVTMMKKRTIENKIKSSQEYYFQDEMLDMKSFLHKDIGFKTLIKDWKDSKIHLLMNKHDRKPVIYKFIYAILRRMK